jgi:Type I phosphodiesterase / nucleotide pyrophosphatase
MKHLLSTVAIGALALAASAGVSRADNDNGIQHVLLISIDGMHALDFANCSGASGGPVTCPTLAALARTGLTYTNASTSKPSDSFPGLTALATGGSPKSTGAFYDVSYDRALSPPAQTTPYGIPGHPEDCPKIIGTQVGFDEQIDIDYTKLDAGGGINPDYLLAIRRTPALPSTPTTSSA